MKEINRGTSFSAACAGDLQKKKKRKEKKNSREFSSPLLIIINNSAPQGIRVQFCFHKAAVACFIFIFIFSNKFLSRFFKCMQTLSMLTFFV